MRRFVVLRKEKLKTAPSVRRGRFLIIQDGSKGRGGRRRAGSLRAPPGSRRIRRWRTHLGRRPREYKPLDRRFRRSLGVLRIGRMISPIPIGAGVVSFLFVSCVSFSSFCVVRRYSGKSVTARFLPYIISPVPRDSRGNVDGQGEGKGSGALHFVFQNV